MAVNAFVKDEEQPLDVTGGRQLAQLFTPRPDRIVIEIFALVGIAPPLQPRLTVMFARRFGPSGIVGRDHMTAVGAARRGEKHSVTSTVHRYFFSFFPVSLFFVRNLDG